MPAPSRSNKQNGLASKLLIIAGYGDELAVYQRARALWNFYASHFPAIEFLFVRDCPNLSIGEITHNGYDLLVGTGQISTGTQSYAKSGRWSPNENQQQIFRQILIYEYLLRQGRGNFFVYQSTITSVVDFRGLLCALEKMPLTNCFAGMPVRLKAPTELSGLTYCSGANTLLSSDLIKCICNRYDPESPLSKLPNDIWQGILLNDIPIIPLQQFSFTQARHEDDSLEDVTRNTERLIQAGHFHFRVKTNSQEQGLAAREDIDPWIMIKIMEVVLRTPVSPEAVIHLMRQLAEFSNADTNGLIQPFTYDKMFKSDERTFPIAEVDLPAWQTGF